MTKANQNKQVLVPELRFPEFRGDGGWNDCDLDSSAKIANQKIAVEKVAIADYVTTENILPNFGELRCASNLPNVKSVTQFLPGDTLFANIRPYLRKAWFATREGGASNDVIVFRARKNISSEFLSVRIRSDAFVDHVMSSAKGLKMPRGDISQMKEFPFPLPPSILEQQKIADCLGSLDDLIAAHSRKLAALQDHKKGLLQQLFPAEGEITPKLRFPEFLNAGKWVVRTIGDMFSLINGCAFKPGDWEQRGTPIIRIQNLNDPSAEFNYSQAPVPERNRVESGDLLFAWSGTLGSSFGARIWNGPSGVLNQHIFKVLVDEQQITLNFALLVLARVEEDIAKRTHGFKASFVHVKKTDLVRVKLRLPTLPEQQKIADCLVALDTLITAQSEQIAAFKEHKQGLMQQLFPNPDPNKL